MGLWLVLACALVASGGCADEEELGTRLDFAPAVLTINAGLNPILSHSFQLRDLSTEHARFEGQHGRAWGAWSRVSPWRASLTINEAGLDWAFVQEVSVQAYRDDFDARREIFYRDQIRPDVGARLELIPSEADVQDLFGGDRVTLVVELRRIAASPPQRIPATLNFSLNAR